MSGQNPFADPAIRKAAFLESAHFLVICNIAPILPGHSLVIPKREVKSLHELSDAEVTEMVLTSRRALRILAAAFHTPDFDWTIQEGVWAGQTIPHLHLHLVPRRKGDLPEPGDWYPELQKGYEGQQMDSADRPRLSEEEMQQIVTRLREIGLQE